METRKHMAIVLAVIGIAFLLYGVAIMMVGSGTLFFMFWYVLGAVFLAASWATHTGLIASLPLAAKAVLIAVVCVVIGTFAFFDALMLQNFNDRGEDGLDYIIVLGAQVRDDGPSVVLQYRLDAAIEYLENNPDTICIVSGGQGPNESQPEAHVMATYLENAGIDPKRILVEDQSENTSQNIANSKQYFNAATDHVGIVTNNFHVYRALRIAQKQGLAHVCGIAAGSSAPYLPNNMAREALAIAKGYLTGSL